MFIYQDPWQVLNKWDVKSICLVDQTFASWGVARRVRRTFCIGSRMCWVQPFWPKGSRKKEEVLASCWSLHAVSSKGLLLVFSDVRVEFSLLPAEMRHHVVSWCYSIHCILSNAQTFEKTTQLTGSKKDRPVYPQDWTSHWWSSSSAFCCKGKWWDPNVYTWPRWCKDQQWID